MAASSERITDGDPSTLANWRAVQTTRLHLDWSVDFERKVLSGTVKFSLKALEDGLAEVVLDTMALTIEAVNLQGSQDKVSFTVADAHPSFGSALHITLPTTVAKGESFDLVIKYQTTNESEALCWLAKEQTDGGNFPYLFSQSQPIFARSMMPCQDTPAVRCPYTATVRCPKDLTALMSALLKNSSIENDLKITEFEQPQDVPSYLIAIVVGELVRKDISGRCAIWTEPVKLEAAAFEFAEMEKFLQVAESICGPYIWGRYDLLILPSSFPYGGMENPCLTFVTPSLVAGDRSLTTVIAHEIAHSWTGNLVGCTSWEDLWLNEGFTMYVERSIAAKMDGDEYFDFDAILGWADLHEEVERRGVDNCYTILRPNLTGVNPDDAFGAIPYEKGFNFLNYLAGQVGGRAKFLDWLRKYLDTFKHQAINAPIFKKHFGDHFGANATEHIDWVTWLDKPGMPPYDPKFSTKLTDGCVALAEKWMREPKERTKTEVEGWGTKQFCCFLEHLLEHRDRIQSTNEMLSAMDLVLQFNKARNAEIVFGWLCLCMKTGYFSANVVMRLRSFMTKQGRVKYLLPLYRMYFKMDGQAARALFEANKMRYHPIAQKEIEELFTSHKRGPLTVSANHPSQDSATSPTSPLSPKPAKLFSHHHHHHRHPHHHHHAHHPS